ncbi:MAG TPA: hypothetical protein VMV13_02220, partial [Candidatus Binataceae bacterium]|nr:hypothetical protein [Candidatus Binataceae bacterium]
LDERDFVPAGGQGALCVEAVAGRLVGGAAELDLAIGALDNERADREVAAERAFLAALGASCVSPVGVKATSSDSALSIHALLFSLDGARHLRDELSDELADRSGASSPTPADAQRLGTALAERMFARGARAMLADG